jgi:hypothetical protein
MPRCGEQKRRQHVACVARQNVAVRLFAHYKTVPLLLPSPFGCHQLAPEALAQRRFTAWSGRRGSNPRQPAWKAGTLPLSYSRILLLSGSGCADLNRGPHGPKPCALPTAPHPANARALSILTTGDHAPDRPRHYRTHAHYSTLLAMCQALLVVISSTIAKFEQEEIPTSRKTTQRITPQWPYIPITRRSCRRARPEHEW